MRYWTVFDKILFSPHLLELYFPTVVFIFQEGSTKVPQIVDQIFSILVVLAYWFLPSPVGRLITIAADIENGAIPTGGFLRPTRNVLDLADLKF